MDDIVLMAYVDGELTSLEREEVEKAMSTSADIAERVALLEASVLPYQRAFRHQALPPVPDSLARKIDELAQAHTVRSSRSRLHRGAVDRGGVHGGRALRRGFGQSGINPLDHVFCVSHRALCAGKKIGLRPDLGPNLQ
ncbi:UNVERIFIED_ORG: anti-sigma factor RsiW [Burkholderia sp. 1263]